MIRKRYKVEGYLFPLGYRTLVTFYAQRFKIKGYIRYQPDETMEIMCEGSRKNMAAFKKGINIRDDMTGLMGFHVRSIRETKPTLNEKLGHFEMKHYRPMTGYEEEKDRLADNLMFTYTWAAHKDSEKAKSERMNKKSEPKKARIHTPPRHLY